MGKKKREISQSILEGSHSEREIRRRLLGKEKQTVNFEDGAKPIVDSNYSSRTVRTTFCYPNRYWVAMSNLGFQTIFKMFRSRGELLVERAFVPEKATELRSFETNSDLSKSDILALSVSFETDYLNVLSFIEACGRDLGDCVSNNGEFGLDSLVDSQPFILGGGAALTLNPEPLAHFFDAIVVGEGEEVLNEVLDVYLESRNQRETRGKLLESLQKLRGLYVPSAYRVKYHPSGPVSAFELKSRDNFIPVERRIVEDLDSFPTHTFIQTEETEFKSMFMTETGRGCEVGCKFCVAGYMYRPVRKRSTEVIRESVQIGLETSDSIGFVGAAVSSHPEIATLASEVASSGKRAALSSLMSQKVDEKLAGSISESEYKTVALAPEAGSESLRFKVGKRVLNSQLEDAVRNLISKGVRNIKLYFIVGLPAEEEEDIDAIIELVRALRDVAFEAARERGDFTVAPRMVLSVNPFIPKAWTPFQRHPFSAYKTLKSKLKRVRSAISRIPNVEMKHESPRESYFQALMSRGDRRLSHALVKIFKENLEWRDVVSLREEKFHPETPAFSFYVERLLEEDEILPWEIIDFQVKRELLERQYQRSFDEDVFELIERAKSKYRPASSDSSTCEMAREAYS